MKRIVLQILILVGATVSAQENSKQNEFIKLAEKKLKKNNVLEALNYFNYVTALDSQTHQGQLAKKKIDSLLPLYQKKLWQECIGKWKIHQLKTTRFDYQYIVITKDSIFFFKDHDLTKPSRTEQIRFVQKDTASIELPISSVKFNNNEIWEFSVEHKNREKRLLPNMKQEADGTVWILLDEREIIRDPVARRKALDKEIRTYYLPLE